MLRREEQKEKEPESLTTTDPHTPARMLTCVAEGKNLPGGAFMLVKGDRK